MQAQQSSTSLQRQIKRLKKRMTRWRFQTLTSHKKAQLQRRLMRYEQQLYRLGSTAALSTLGLSALQGQAFCEQVGSDSPFDGLAVAGESTPQLVDVDGDGDLDLVSGIGGNDNQPINGQIAYYQNDGNDNFIQQTGTANPFDGIDVGREASPQLVDVDGDGDLDLISGEVFGRVFYYQNDGNNNFIRRTGTDNPFNGIDTGYYSKPQLIDFDGDGDLDLVSGFGDPLRSSNPDPANGTISYYQNDGNNNFNQQTGTANPFMGINLGYRPAVYLADLDADCDIDVIAGNRMGIIQYYRNDGDNNFSQQTGTANPFEKIDVGQYATPRLVDHDQDGDFDLIIGDRQGNFFYFLNEPTCLSANLDGFVECDKDIFDEIVVMEHAAPQFVDVDSDGDLDLMVGDYYGIAYYQNDGNNNFTPQTGSNNPFDGINGYQYTPQLINLTGSEDKDLIIGEYYGTIVYYENMGSNNFVQQTGTNNPFDGIEPDFYTRPQLVDVDEDSDLDLIVGAYDGIIYYYQNDGSNNFTELTGNANPFDGIDIGFNAAPQLADVDDDDNLDLIVGDFGGDIFYFQNDGNNNFIEQTGSSNPFEQFDVVGYASPQLVDIDEDGDLDLIVGDEDGLLFFFQNLDLSVTAATDNCTNNEGEVELTIVSTDTPGPYIISRSFLGTIGMEGVFGATSTLSTGISQPGLYGFEVTVEPFGCTAAAAIATIDENCIVPTTSLKDVRTYTDIQAVEICTADTITSTATVEASATLTYTASQTILLEAGFAAKAGSTFTARIGICSTPANEEIVEQRTSQVKLDDFIDEQTLLSVFPIPVSTHLYYKVEHIEEVEAIYLFDMLGRLVREERNLDGEIDISDLPNGQYALVLVGEEQRVHRLVQKQ